MHNSYTTAAQQWLASVAELVLLRAGVVAHWQRSSKLHAHSHIYRSMQRSHSWKVERDSRAGVYVCVYANALAICWACERVRAQIENENLQLGEKTKKKRKENGNKKFVLKRIYFLAQWLL